MGKPCIVCEENCPVSPKAIYVHEYFDTVRDGVLTIKKATGRMIETVEAAMVSGKFATGDYYCAIQGWEHRKITANTENSIEISGSEKFVEIPVAGSKIEIQVRLQRPFVDIEKCIGCGICEHECPVSGIRAIRVWPEGETRSVDRKLLL
jgi:formate hydrogenlyase subunit 6/NADH:ubiquinone oxidoreductase subunit I